MDRMTKRGDMEKKKREKSYDRQNTGTEEKKGQEVREVDPYPSPSTNLKDILHLYRVDLQTLHNFKNVKYSFPRYKFSPVQK